MTLARSTKQRWQIPQFLVLASLSGLLYASWPLGYVLNPITNRGLVSNLEGLGQPYNWLFISLDIISGVAVCVVARWLWQRTAGKRTMVTTAAVGSYALFGLLTAIDALIPVDCAADQGQCGNVINHPLVIWHGLISLASIGFLTLSLVIIWWQFSRRQASPSVVRYGLHSAVAIWFFFGIVTAILVGLNRSSALSQHSFIIACSLWTGIFPYFIWHGSESFRRNRRPLIPVAKSRLGA